jgi:hypothetical protein
LEEGNLFHPFPTSFQPLPPTSTRFSHLLFRARFPPVNRPLLGLALALIACQSNSQPYHGLSAGTTTPPTSLLRLPSAGGTAELYRLPTLENWGWKASTGLPALRRVVAADLDVGVVYALTTKNEIVALDLQTGRPRVQIADGVRDVAMGPDGTLHTVDDSLQILQIVHRNPTRISRPLAGRPREMFGGRNSTLIALAGHTLSIVRGEEAPVRQTLPSGDASATYWGDLIAIAADSAVILLDPDTPDKVRVLPVSGHARAVLFSPSGHRFYVARREGSVLIFSRFTREQVGEIKLPGPAAALRSDPFGRWLMVHPAGRDSLWLVDLATNRFVGGFAATWATDLPTISNQQTLLLKTNGDVVAYSLTQGDFPEKGRVPDGAADFWLPLAWTPETGTASIAVAPAPDSTPATADSVEVPQVYLQVSSSQNKDWASELARQLEQQGLPASVLDPRAPDDGFRVVLGPYPSREAADATGKRLGRPYFIYQPDR